MKRKLLYTAAVVVVAIVGYLLLFSKGETGTTDYSFAPVTRGDVENTVSATGTLSPVTTVEVGTQVSGTIDSIYVDYNDEVKAGQVLAVLDRSLLEASLLDAQASLERTEAQLEQAQSDFDRNEALFNRGLISEADFTPYRVSLKSQKASLTSAQAALDRASQNLDYAVIKAPISGIVIARDVESGQTVASSFSTPTLFKIAEDMSHMEILADVDESDIGQIKEGQEVRFEVATYSDRKFTGLVKQVRLQPTTVSNVVTYTVVIGADNPDGVLLPGMTATMDIITERRSDVLLVPNKALRFSPDEEQMQAFYEKMRAERAQRQGSGERPPEAGDSTSAGQGMRAGGQGGSAQRTRPKDAGTVWYVDSTGNLAAAMLRTGLSDGTNTEVVASRTLKEGMEIIAGLATATASTSNSSSQQSQGFGGPPPMGRGF